MKKKILVLALLAILSAMCVTGTFAYFVTDYDTHNVITSGGVHIEVILKELDSQGVEVDADSFELDKIMPGVPEDRILRFKNVGNNPMWLRAAISYKIIGSDGNELPLTKDGTDLVWHVANSKDWKLHSDGFYYYNDIVESRGQTKNLFEEINFHGSMGNEYTNCKIILTVLTHAVQSQHNGDNAIEASGWPTI